MSKNRQRNFGGGRSGTSKVVQIPHAESGLLSAAACGALQSRTLIEVPCSASGDCSYNPTPDESALPHRLRFYSRSQKGSASRVAGSVRRSYVEAPCRESEIQYPKKGNPKNICPTRLPGTHKSLGHLQDPGWPTRRF